MNFLAATVELPDIDIVGAAAIITAITVIVLGIRGFNRAMKKFNKFFDDWYGDQEAGKEGVVHRLSALEFNQQEIKTEISDIRGTVLRQLNRNGGSSMADMTADSLRAIGDLQLQVENEVLARKDWEARYANDQAVTREEWIRVFATITDMIPKETHEQLAIWDELTKKYTRGEL